MPFITTNSATFAPINVQELTTEVFPCVYELWNINTQVYLQSLDENASTELSHSYLEKAVILLRILRKFTIFGVAEPRQSKPCSLFMGSMIPCLNKFVEYRFRLLDMKRQQPAEGDWSRLIELTEKFILKSMKILSDFAEMHSDAFAEYLPMALEFAFNYVFYTGTRLIFDSDNQINFPNFAIYCINLMKQVARKASSSYPADGEDPINSEAKNSFFTAERLSYISEKVITYYFLLTPKDLEQWDDDPEQYSHDETGESWKYDLRPCVETFYLALFSQYRSDMVSDLVKYIRQAQETTLTPDAKMDAIFLKDAIYKAAGLSSFNLFDEVSARRSVRMHQIP